MDEDFGFVERRPAGTTLISPSKIEHGKLTNGSHSTNNNNNESRINLHPDDDCRDATSAKASDSLDPSLRTLSLSDGGGGDPSFGSGKKPEENEENNNNNNPVDSSLPNSGNNMLKHIKTASKTVRAGTGISPASKVPKSPSSESSVLSSPSQQQSANGSPDKLTKSPGSPTEPEQISLPQRFVVKYLGYRETSNLWGIKYTRKPVDEMVTEAKSMLAKHTDKSLPLLKLEVTESGIHIGPMPQNNNPVYPSGKFAIEAISYGVQDLVYTRVFAMIVVKSALSTDDQASQSIRLAEIQKAAASTNNSGMNGEALPFRCHAFVCDSRQTARKLTYSLAAAFHKFSKSVAAGKISLQKPKKFAIDLRSPEDIEADLDETEA